MQCEAIKVEGMTKIYDESKFPTTLLTIQTLNWFAIFLIYLSFFRTHFKRIYFTIQLVQQKSGGFTLTELIDENLSTLPLSVMGIYFFHFQQPFFPSKSTSQFISFHSQTLSHLHQYCLLL